MNVHNYSNQWLLIIGLNEWIVYRVYWTGISEFLILDFLFFLFLFMFLWNLVNLYNSIPVSGLHICWLSNFDVHIIERLTARSNSWTFDVNPDGMIANLDSFNFIKCSIDEMWAMHIKQKQWRYFWIWVLRSLWGNVIRLFHTLLTHISSVS